MSSPNNKFLTSNGNCYIHLKSDLKMILPSLSKPLDRNEAHMTSTMEDTRSQSK